MPYITKADVGELSGLNVFGDYYDILGRTGVRDYIHVVDLAKSHIKALDKLKESCGLVTYNLGTEQGYSVLEMINIFRQTSDRNIPYKIVDRRPGDIDECYADPQKALVELG